MDVRCDKCGTEYEFDEARVGDNGVTVKCTNCQHVFRVRRPQSSPSTPAGAREWLVKKPDGQMIAFRELTTLQKWIVEGRIARDDEISRNGETWKRLGNIAELEPFFSVFERARALNDLMATGAIGDRPLMVNGSEILATMSPLSSIVAASSPLPDRGEDGVPARRTSEAPPRRTASVITRSVPARAERTRGPSLITRRPEVDEPPTAPLPHVGESSTERNVPTMSRAAAVPTEAVPRVALSRANSGPPVPLTARPSREATVGLQGPPRAAPAPRAASPAPAAAGAISPMSAMGARTSTGLLGPGALSDVDALSPVRATAADEADALVDGFQKKRRRRTATLFLAVFMALGLGGGAALATLGPAENPLRRFAQRAGLLPPPPPAAPDRASELIEAARRAHDLDRLETLAEADRAYTEALALRDTPALRADLSLVLTTWADTLRTSASRDDARAVATPPPADAAQLAARAEASRTQASALMKRAFELVRVAYEKEPASLGPSRALADYYRVQRDESGRFAQLLGQARAAAQAAGTNDAAVSYVEAAQLARDPERASPADLDRAAKLLNDALTVRPTLVRARVMLGRIALARGQAPVAAGELRRALEASPGHGEAAALLALAEAALAAPAPADAGVVSVDGAALPVASAVPGPSGTPAASATPAPIATPTPAATAAASTSPSAPSSPAATPTPSPSAVASASPRATAGASPATSAPATAGPAGGAKGADALIKAADRLRERGEAWDALLSYEKASVLRPYSGRAYSGMGWSYLDLQKPEAALHQFRKAIAVEPGYPEGHLGHAEAYRALGNADKALGSYKRFLELKPEGAGADSARRAIAALEGGGGT